MNQNLRNKKVTLDVIAELVELDDNLGICLSCGEVQEGVEPDAERYRCESCGRHSVYGAEQALLLAGV